MILFRRIKNYQNKKGTWLKQGNGTQIKWYGRTFFYGSLLSDKK